MSHFFRLPFAFFFDYLSFKLKFALMLTCFLGALLISLFSIWKIQNAHMRTTEIELQGLEHQKLLRKTWEDLLVYSLLLEKSHVDNQESLRSDLVKKQASLNEDFNQIRKIKDFWFSVLQRRFPGSELREESNFDPEELSKQWQNIKDELFVPSEQSMGGHFLEKLITDLSQLSQFIVNSSNLNGDPDLRVDALLKATSEQIPRIQEEVVNLTRLELQGQKAPKTLLKGNLLLEKIRALDNDLKISIVRILIKSSPNAQKLTDWQEKVAIAWSTYQKILSNFISEASTIFQLTSEPTATLVESTRNANESREKETKRMENVRELSLPAHQLLESSFLLWDLSMLRVQQILSERVQTLKNQLLYTFLSVLSLGVIATLIAALLGYQTSTSLEGSTNAIGELEKGNKGIRLPVYFKDEIGKVCSALNAILDKDKLIAEQLNQATTELADVSNKLGVESKTQQEIALKQAGASAEIVSSTLQIENASKEIAKTSETMRHSSQETSILAIEGKETLNTIEQVIAKTMDAATSINVKLIILNEKARTLITGIATIAKVADQTNLLSLNAAIEAEKAGEHGRSFGVIAEEIRRLADQTSNAIMDIERTVAEMSTAVSIGIEGMQKFKDEILSGNNQIQETLDVLNKVFDRTQNFLAALNSVGRNIQNQLSASEAITETTASLSLLSDQSNLATKNLSSSVGQLIKSSEAMQQLINKI